MEATYTGEGGMPPMRLHPTQAERFEILEGRIRAIVDGEERVYGTGGCAGRSGRRCEGVVRTFGP